MLLDVLEQSTPPTSIIGLPDDSGKADAVRLDKWRDRGVHIRKPKELAEVVSYVRESKPDLIIEFGDSRIIPSEILAIPRLGVVGNHGALLPFVKGAASLVWGRMCDLGAWGVSLYYVSKEIDGGGIIGTKSFSYPRGCTMRRFVDEANKATIAILRDAIADICSGTVRLRDNPPAEIRFPKNADSYEVVQDLRKALESARRVYLPPRRPQDACVLSHWPLSFVEAFRLANDDPYPRFHFPEKGPSNTVLPRL